MKTTLFVLILAFASASAFADQTTAPAQTGAAATPATTTTKKTTKHHKKKAEKKTDATAK
jgi:hypothetical protein